MLRTHENRRILIPNATLLTDRITIITAYEQRRLSFPSTIDSVDDIALARNAIVEALCGTGDVLADPGPVLPASAWSRVPGSNHPVAGTRLTPATGQSSL